MPMESQLPGCGRAGTILSMPALAAYDGTKLAYHVLGEGAPVVCLPGGPMQDSEYLGDLGGLSERVRLILLDPRGTGQSATPADPASYRCDRLVDDVEALREHLGLASMNLLAHSGGTNLAVLYAARYPEHIGKLVLVTPSTYAVGLTATADDRREVLRLREGESWFGRRRRPSRGSTPGRPRTATGQPSHPSPTASGTPRHKPTTPVDRRGATTRPPPSSAPRAPSIPRPPARHWPPSARRSSCSPERSM